ncbi:BadF/BadG/BcrA/BcrD ATPase family protein [Aliiroseovarius marinus]|uniref:BadF/BadG/BcrA/BcrD ATPase family protein n=1 Tax=Aliiroseovarius marinus TaxID=2500159 RepID=UPI003D7C4F92
MNRMTTHTTSPVLAIDGGGTRCRLALRDRQEDAIVELGSANVTTDFDAGISELIRGLDQLAARTGLSLAALSKFPAYVGLAGVAGEAIADRAAKALPFEHILVEDDRPSALVGALGAKDGIVAHCGTGSFLAAQSDGRRRFAGGWGPVLGDPASAQWVGRRGLTMTLNAVDGICDHSALSRYFLDRFSGAAGIVAFAATARPSEFGALAPQVTAHAEDKDRLARKVMQEAGDSIADALPVLGWLPGMTICLTGGIAPHYAPYLPDTMQSCIAAPLGSPLSGALALAQAFSEEITA